VSVPNGEASTFAKAPSDFTEARRAEAGQTEAPQSGAASHKPPRRG
jgi:hypothetical protein